MNELVKALLFDYGGIDEYTRYEVDGSRLRVWYLFGDKVVEFNVWEAMATLFAETRQD